MAALPLAPWRRELQANRAMREAPFADWLAWHGSRQDHLLVRCALGRTATSTMSADPLRLGGGELSTVDVYTSHWCPERVVAPAGPNQVYVHPMTYCQLFIELHPGLTYADKNRLHARLRYEARRMQKLGIAEVLRPTILKEQRLP